LLDSPHCFPRALYDDGLLEVAREELKLAGRRVGGQLNRVRAVSADTSPSSVLALWTTVT
jgi:hypothetical protein